MHHLPIPESERVLLPRALVGRPSVPCTPLTMQTGEWQQPEEMPPRVEVKRFKFGIGAHVIFSGMLAVVLEHHASWCGMQMYVIQILDDRTDRPIRRVHGAQYLTRAPRN